MFLHAGVPLAAEDHYDLCLANTVKYNEPHHVALADPASLLRRRLFIYARDPWEGETLELKVALIQAMENWEMLTGEGTSGPIEFGSVGVDKTMALNEKQGKADETLALIQRMIGFAIDGWVPTGHYDEAMRRDELAKQLILAGVESERERAEILENRPLTDMDETGCG